jgi:type IV pilus assembly protein PilB
MTRTVVGNEHVVTEMQLTDASAQAQGLTGVDLIGYLIDVEAMTRIPLSLVIRHRVLGIAITGNDLVVAPSDPHDVVALDDLARTFQPEDSGVSALDAGATPRSSTTSTP